MNARTWIFFGFSTPLFSLISSHKVFELQDSFRWATAGLRIYVNEEIEPKLSMLNEPAL
jgi:hypothetical protein